MSAIPARLPWRPLREGSAGKPLHPRPTVAGLQTALVVGVQGAPLTADRDHRIKIQFHWQRGDKSHSTQTHPGGSNAPADDTAGTWVRVLTPMAGANWGGHFLPRIGQEVLVGFLEGDIERPVVIGAAWNGRGQPDSQANGTGASVGSATANAPAWFPGGAAPPASANPSSPSAAAAPAGVTPAAVSSTSTPAAENHAHRAIFSGWKTQELQASQSGQGGYNALIFDDTPAQAGLRLLTTQYASALNLGHLKQQTDNRRQQDRGHGAELVTGAYGAVRAGAGLLLTAHTRPGAGPQLDAREALAQTQQGKELTRSLAATAQKQGAQLPGEAAPDKLPTLEQWQAAETTLNTTAQRGEPAGDTGQANPANDPASPGFIATQGGAGTVPAWDKPLMALSAPAGIGAFTPADALLSAGQTLSLAAGQDANFAVQGTSAWAVKEGIVFFTHGQAQKGPKPNQETGIKLHAASGSVSLQSQSDETTIAAQKTVTVASTTQNVTLTAPQHLLLTAGGAYLRIEGGNIQLHAPGKVTFHSSMKTLTGPASAGASLALPKGSLADCPSKLASACAQGASAI